MPDVSVLRAVDSQCYLWGTSRSSLILQCSLVPIKINKHEDRMARVSESEIDPGTA